MRNQISKSKVAIALLAAVAAVVSVSMLISISCTKRLDGEINANEKPIVYFVNIPPEGQKFSRNPEIHWVGTDRDGLIAFFRYHVATAAQLGGLDPMDYIMTIGTSDWVRLDVDPKGPDPMTSNIVSMSADLTDPVLTYVDQYVFLQAYDEEGLGSDIIYRVYSRNDNPPNSFITGFRPTDTPFVNSVYPGGIITGVKLRWSGDDRIDYPHEPPPFEFDWRLYGPYFLEEMKVIRDSFMTVVYVTTDGGVYRLGDTVVRCDTFFVEEAFVDSCDTLVVTRETPSSAFGQMEPYMRVSDPDFVGSNFDRVQQAEGWVSRMADTLYNVFQGFESDTTVEMRYVLWLRSRDDARVPDLVPAFVEFPVINPRYERDVAVIDLTKTVSARLTAPVHKDVSKRFWKRVIDQWGVNIGRAVVFDTTTIVSGPLGKKDVSADYIYTAKLPDGVPIAELLKHKVLILYDDALAAEELYKWPTLYKSIDAGINVWMTGRTPLSNTQTPLTPATEITPPFEYRLYFGVEQMAYGGWMCYLQAFSGDCQPWGLYQDFIGTYSLDTTAWPNLYIDRDLLFDSYNWFGGLIWNEDSPALPDVGWSVRSFGTEVLYLYRSSYGRSHPLGEPRNFEGNPVAHRLATNLFRTIHCNFTPVTIEPDQVQILVDSVLNWLYDPTLGTLDGQVSENRYSDGRVHVSLAEARRNYEQRTERYEKLRQEALIIE